MSEALKGWLDEKIEGLGALERSLHADARDDEATLARIGSNVYDIVRTVLGVAERQNPGNDLAAREFFLGRIERLRAEWSAAREKATVHDDMQRVHVEDEKLGALAEVHAATDELWALQ